MAEQYLDEAQLIYRSSGDLLGLASCAELVGHLRHKQERNDEAIIQLQLASSRFVSLKLQSESERCQKWINSFKSTNTATE